MKFPCISVIIPCYNCAVWIRQCLNSLKQQTYTDFEVICIDDCSTDNTLKIIESYVQENNFDIKLMVNQINSGPAISRNNAISQARGRWLAFCDSDDWYDPNFLEEMFHAAVKESADLVMCEYKKVFESRRQPQEVHYLSLLPSNATPDDYLVYSKAAMWLILVKSELLKQFPMPALRNGEDIAYVPCIESYAKRISVVKKAMYNYRMHKSSISNKTTIGIYRSLQNAFTFIEDNIAPCNPAVLEHLGVRTIMYGVTLNAFKAGISAVEVGEIVRSFTEKYPDWKNNKYNKLFSSQKRLYLAAIDKKNFTACKIMAKIHAVVSIQ